MVATKTLLEGKLLILTYFFLKQLYFSLSNQLQLAYKYFTYVCTLSRSVFIFTHNTTSGKETLIIFIANDLSAHPFDPYTILLMQKITISDLNVLSRKYNLLHKDGITFSNLRINANDPNSFQLKYKLTLKRNQRTFVDAI
jgi:hypothetical protein